MKNLRSPADGSGGGTVFERRNIREEERERTPRQFENDLSRYAWKGSPSPAVGIGKTVLLEPSGIAACAHPRPG